MLFLYLQPMKTNPLTRQIPNAFTFCNLLSGCVAAFFAVSGHLEWAAYSAFLGIFFDFFDGFLARVFQVEGAFGKQLDSLADMVTSGLVPGMVMVYLLMQASEIPDMDALFAASSEHWYPFCGLLITLASANRLAVFNLDKDQESSFLGLPTPANTLLILSLPLIQKYSSFSVAVELTKNTSFLLFLTLISTYLLNARIPLFALKFKTFSWSENAFQFVFVIVSIVLLIALQYLALPMIVLLYVFVSLIKNRLCK